MTTETLAEKIAELLAKELPYATPKRRGELSDDVVAACIRAGHRCPQCATPRVCSRDGACLADKANYNRVTAKAA